METAIVFLPLAAAIVAGFFGRAIGDRGAHFVTCAAVCLAAVLSWIVFFQVAVGGHPRTVDLLTWIDSGALEVSWALRVDTLTAVMFIVVNTVSAMVHLYSIGYMHHDEHQPRFFAYLSLFTFFMLMLVTSDNLVQMYFGWEGVGVASYLLINFWYTKPSANAAAMKAFIVNRVGDFGFALGIFAVFMIFGSVEFDTIFRAAPEQANQRFEFLGANVHALTAACLLLFMGAMGKSAQLGLHTWLPDAMEGPTPVSALIHAATMVTAGVFMVARLSPIFEFAPNALMFVCVVGALTAFVAATIGFTQFDIKRVIAYSTMSQLGYMFFALGVSAYSAAMFHLMTHAFFKALLFLGAGSVIHAMSDEQDMRNMGGIAKDIRWTYAFMWIGSLALAGVGIPGTHIGFAGFHSKDIILEAAYMDGSWFGYLAFWLGIAAAFMTAFYSWRLLLMTFHGKPRADEKVMAHVHESPWIMLGPLVPLAIGAVVAGAVAYELFVGHEAEHFWHGSIFVRPENDTVHAAHNAPFWVASLPVVVALAGIGLAYYMYQIRPEMPARVQARFPNLHRFLYNRWYFDDLYDRIFVKPALALGFTFWKGGDGAVIDRFGPDGAAVATRMLAGRAVRIQTGYVYHYAFAMVIGIVALIAWFFLFAR